MCGERYVCVVRGMCVGACVVIGMRACVVSVTV